LDELKSSITAARESPAVTRQDFLTVANKADGVIKELRDNLPTETATPQERGAYRRYLRNALFVILDLNEISPIQQDYLAMFQDALEHLPMVVDKDSAKRGLEYLTEILKETKQRFGISEREDATGMISNV
jgi:hypothetical protein